MAEEYCILDSSEMKENKEKCPATVHVLYKLPCGTFYLDQGDKRRGSTLNAVGINLGINIAYAYNYIMKLGLIEINNDEIPPLIRKALDTTTGTCGSPQGQNNSKETHIAVFIKPQEKKTKSLGTFVS